jgi:hypothetical protein
MWRGSGDKLHEREKSGLLDIRPVALVIWHLVVTNPMRPQVQPLQPLQYNNKVKNISTTSTYTAGIFTHFNIYSRNIETFQHINSRNIDTNIKF